MTKALLIILAMVGSVAEVPNPRTQNRWVTDMVDMIPPLIESRIEQTIDGLHRELGVEITVVIVDDVISTPKEFATELFNFWGVGKARADNGLLILLVRDKRRLEMETGYGLEETLPDAWLGSMQLSDVVPLFKQGDFGGGIESGLNRIAERLRRNAAGLPLFDTPSPSERSARYGASKSPAGRLWGFFSFMVGLAFIAGIVFLVKRYNRRCPTCKTQMKLLPEDVEDQYLNDKQEFEESLRSVLYDVYQCQTCQHTKIIEYNKWFSGYSRCSSCDTKALQRSSTTLVHATYDSGGLVEVRERCVRCNYSNTYTRSTPRLTRPSSSSSSSYSGGSSSSWSSGGSSFGGGRSGGGGAGSSW